MTTTSGTGKRSDARRAGAFTLVELILVMALMVIAVSIVMPTLAKFFGGRALDSEVKNFMALMHYGQSRAVSEGTPMMLWIDSPKRKYGLEREPGYGGTDTHAVENKLADGLKIEVARNNVKSVLANSQTGRILQGQVTQSRNKLPAIYFLPDGSISAATSVGGVSLQDKNSAPVWIAPGGTQTGFTVQTQDEYKASHH